MNELYALLLLLTTFGGGFWVGFERGARHTARYAYASGLRHAKNMLRRRL